MHESLDMSTCKVKLGYAHVNWHLSIMETKRIPHANTVKKSLKQPLDINTESLGLPKRRHSFGIQAVELMGNQLMQVHLVK